MEPAILAFDVCCLPQFSSPAVVLGDKTLNKSEFMENLLELAISLRPVYLRLRSKTVLK